MAVTSIHFVYCVIHRPDVKYIYTVRGAQSGYLWYLHTFDILRQWTKFSQSTTGIWSENTRWMKDWRLNIWGILKYNEWSFYLCCLDTLLMEVVYSSAILSIKTIRIKLMQLPTNKLDFYSLDKHISHLGKRCFLMNMLSYWNGC